MCRKQSVLGMECCIGPTAATPAKVVQKYQAFHTPCVWLLVYYWGDWDTVFVGAAFTPSTCLTTTTIAVTRIRTCLHPLMAPLQMRDAQTTYVCAVEEQPSSLACAVNCISDCTAPCPVNQWSIPAPTCAYTFGTPLYHHHLVHTGF